MEKCNISIQNSSASIISWVAYLVFARNQIILTEVRIIFLSNHPFVVAREVNLKCKARHTPQSGQKKAMVHL